ncbi:MAG: hypothetical protein WCE50_05780 [Candidatus Acidiferrum sp.]
MKTKLRGLQVKLSISLGALLILSCAIAGLADQKKKAAIPSLSVFAQDQGKLSIKLDGKTVGHEEFEITPSDGGWLAKGNAEIKTTQGAASKVTGTLTLQPDGTPISYDWTAQTEKKNGANILFANGIANVTVEMEGARACTPDEIKDPNRKQPCFFEQSFSFSSPLILVLDNNLYYQYGVLARLYDWSKRGPQTFPVFIPQELMPGTITAEATGSATIDGKSYEGFRVTTSDLEVDLYLDANHRLMRLEVPTAKVSVVRD